MSRFQLFGSLFATILSDISQPQTSIMHSLSSVSPQQQALLQQFQQGDFRARWELTKALVALGPSIIPILSQWLCFESSAAELDWFIARLLGELEHPATIPLLTRLLQHPDADVQNQATAGLAQLGASAIPALQAQLENPQTCLLAVHALHQINDPQIIPLLLTVITHPQAPVREVVLATLSGYACAERLSDLLPIFVTALVDPVAQVRVTALRTLGRIAAANKHQSQASPDNVLGSDLQGSGGQASDWAALISPLLWDVNLPVAQQAALALGHVGNDQSTHALQERLQQPTPIPLLEKIIHALAWIGTESAILALGQIWQNQAEPKVQQEIAAILGRLPEALHPLATELLLTHLQTEPPPALAVKQAMIHSLGSLGQPQAIDALIGLLADPHPGVQLHIVAALKQLNPALSYQSLQRKSQEPLLSPNLHRGLTLALQEWST